MGTTKRRENSGAAVCRSRRYDPPDPFTRKISKELFMFDVLLKELAKRLNLGEKANGLLSMLLSLMFDAKRGGFAGFIDRFRAKGLGETVTSWLGNGENRALSNAQLESVLGPQVIQQMASRLDIAPGSVSIALSHLLPSVIDKLSPDGKFPTGAAVPSAASAYVGQFADFSSTAIMPEVLASQAAAHTITHGAGGSGASKLWLLLIPVLITPLFFIRQCSHEVPAVQTPAPTAISVTNTAPQLPAVASEPTAAPATEPGIEPSVHQDGLEASAAVTPDAGNALDAVLGAERFSNIDLVNALNLMIVHFESGQATIKPDSLAILEKAAAAINKAPAGTKLGITGHTDNRGQAAENLSLSSARANAVLAKLAELGVDKSIMSATGMGDTQPAADNSTKAGRAKNRRIAFSVL
jgi:outer membrane protein OmpA-like peptidoglycan-associated protein/uncharacterized protein YidB (DUF937 family)